MGNIGIYEVVCKYSPHKSRRSDSAKNGEWPVTGETETRKDNDGNVLETLRQVAVVSEGV